jgi:magnesium-transporting ATPase (P-type)
VSKKTGEIVYSGSVARQGEMVALVTATGGDTFFGRTAKLVEDDNFMRTLRALIQARQRYLDEPTWMDRAPAHDFTSGATSARASMPRANSSPFIRSTIPCGCR